MLTNFYARRGPRFCGCSKKLKRSAVSFRCSSMTRIKRTMRLQNCRHPILQGLELLETNFGHGESFWAVGVLPKFKVAHSPFGNLADLSPKR
jgi:hypothetical protein